MNVLERTRESDHALNWRGGPGGDADGHRGRMVIGGIAWLVAHCFVSHYVPALRYCQPGDFSIAITFIYLPGICHLAAGGTGALGSGQHPTGRNAAA